MSPNAPNFPPVEYGFQHAWLSLARRGRSRSSKARSTPKYAMCAMKCMHCCVRKCCKVSYVAPFVELSIGACFPVGLSLLSLPARQPTKKNIVPKYCQVSLPSLLAAEQNSQKILAYSSKYGSPLCQQRHVKPPSLPRVNQTKKNAPRVLVWFHLDPWER